VPIDSTREGFILSFFWLIHALSLPFSLRFSSLMLIRLSDICDLGKPAPPGDSHVEWLPPPFSSLFPGHSGTQFFFRFFIFPPVFPLFFPFLHA